jgi:predicted SnoaL-like aldol condensation-catalyzing enzyme
VDRGSNGFPAVTVDSMRITSPRARHPAAITRVRQLPNAFAAALALLLPLATVGCSSAAQQQNPPAAAPPSAVQSTGDGQTAATKALVTTFYDRVLIKVDPDAIDEYVGPTYRQHNPTVADGPDDFRRLVTNLKTSAPNRHNTVQRVIAQGDLVLLHTRSQNKPGPDVALTDIFRVTDGKASEHWDTIQPAPATTASGNDMFATLSQPQPGDNQPATSTASTERLVRNYFTELNQNKDLTAIDRYVSSSIDEHDPVLATGSAALRSAYATRFAEAPQSSASSALFITEGDLAAVRYHYRSNAPDRGKAVTEIFRVRDGKIVERWTVSQPVPPQSANPNTMF